MPGDERAVETLAAAPTMRLAGVMLQGVMLRGAEAPAAPCATTPDAARARSLQAVIVIECDDLGAQRAHLSRLALPLADEVGHDAVLAPAETGTCAIRFTQATEAASVAGSASASASESASTSAERAPVPALSPALLGIALAALAPQRLAAHLALIIGVPVIRSAEGVPALLFGDAQLRVVVADDNGEGLAAIE
ncbi:hypothetical protein BH11PSE9_BH11PSE9_32580 [soil metagenome]